MKGSSFLLFLVFVLAGYVLHPMILPFLQNSGAGITEKEAEGANEEIATDGDAADGVDLAKLDPSRFPAKVKLGVDSEVVMPGDIAIKVDKGSKVIPLFIDDGKLVFTISGATDGAGRVAVDDTDLLALLKPEGAAAPVVVEKTPEPIAPEKPIQTPEEEVPPVVVEPQPEPVVPEPVITKVLSDEAIVALMQQSVRAGEVSEVKFDKVIKWQPSLSETHDDVEYQVGMVHFTGETFFGVQKMKAKVLILDGEVVKWLWADAGVPMR